MNKELLDAFRENETRDFSPTEKKLFSLLGSSLVARIMLRRLAAPDTEEAAVISTILIALTDSLVGFYEKLPQTDVAKVLRAIENSCNFVKERTR